MDENEVSSPAEGVTPDDIETIADSQSEDGAEEETGTEALEVDEGDAASEEGDGDDADPEGDDEGEDGDEVEEIELNFGGEKLRVPKGAIPEEVAAKVSEMAHNLEAGYTKKFQDVAERGKSLEAREAAIQRAQELQGDALTKFSDGLHLQNEIARLEQVDINALRQSDPDQARWVSDDLATKRAELQNTIAEINKAEAASMEAQRAEMARRVEEGKELIERKAPGFSKVLPEVIQFAVDELGVDKVQAEAEWALNPPMALAVLDAMKYRQMKAQAKQSTSPKPKKAKPVGKTTGGAGVVQGDVSDPAQMAKLLGLTG